ncbi:MAG: hypothetical protein IKW70_06280 [Verrucomicrobia bacterium]|nr:hypothetical protein [Verrucomicrobiota bacterium]
MLKDYRSIRVVGAALYLLPVETRIPLKLGRETLTSVTCARVKLCVVDTNGTKAEGWGEVPLNVSWCWPSALSVQERVDTLIDLSRSIA